MIYNYTIYQIGIRIFWIFGFTIIFLFQKLELHRLINLYHTKVLDSISKYITHIGDGLFFILIIVFSLLFSLKKSLLLFITFIVTAGITQFLKRGVFPNVMRPMHFFQNDVNFHKIENFTYHFNNSFPSGHATSCFALFTLLAIFSSNNKLFQIIFLFSALLISFTRVYLSQHFFQDILAGSIIGTFVAEYTSKYFNTILKKWDYPIHKKIKK